MSCPHCHRVGATAPGVPAAEQAPPPAPGQAAPKPLAPGQAAPKPRRFRRGARRVTAVLPGILLVLMPKCPICLAAYIALITGVSIPITAATWLRWSLIVLCIVALVRLAIRWSLYLYRHSMH